MTIQSANVAPQPNVITLAITNPDAVTTSRDIEILHGASFQISQEKQTELKGKIEAFHKELEELQTQASEFDDHLTLFQADATSTIKDLKELDKDVSDMLERNKASRSEMAKRKQDFISGIKGFQGSLKALSEALDKRDQQRANR